MEGGLLLALDAGTTGVRAMLVDPAGAVLRVVKRPIVSRFPAPGLVEQDAAEVWNVCRAVIDGALTAAERSIADVAAIGVTTQRASIIQFAKGEATLDASDSALLDKTFADQRGASYFLVVSRASPDGKTENNRELSRQRAESVMGHLRQTFADPDLEREVGLLWLGEEFAQLDQSFCEWSRSGGKDECRDEHLNRSAFVAPPASYSNRRPAISASSRDIRRSACSAVAPGSTATNSSPP